MMTIPLGPIIRKGFVVWVLLGVGGWLVLSIVYPASSVEVLVGAAVPLLISVALFSGTRPWLPRPVQTWGSVLVLVQGVSVMAIILATLALLYSSPLSDPLALTLSEVISFIASWFVIAREYQSQSQIAQHGEAVTDGTSDPTPGV